MSKISLQYYFNPKKKQVAHLWSGEDTVCTMLSSGGMSAGAKQLFDSSHGRKICLMCQNNFKKYYLDKNVA
jgi:hypothetical protein